VCLGILCIVAAHHFGAQSAKAQAPGNSVVAGASEYYAVTANGDFYMASGPAGAGPWTWKSNVFGGSSPTPAQSISMGQLKAKYATPAQGK
jgi:hypothetical protein